MGGLSGESILSKNYKRILTREDSQSLFEQEGSGIAVDEVNSAGAAEKLPKLSNFPVF